MRRWNPCCVSSTAIRLLDLCGFNPLPVRRRGESGRLADTVPNGWNVSRFLKALVEVEEEQGLVSAMVDDLRSALMAEIPDFGRHLGCDGKAIENHSTGIGNRESGTTSDPDADWGKHETSGVGRNGKLWTKVTTWFGYKLHVIADTRHEIPVAASLTRASVSEAKELGRMVARLMERDPVLAERCSEFSADRGLDSGSLKEGLWDRWRIRPFIEPVSCGARRGTSRATTRPGRSPVRWIRTGRTRWSTASAASCSASARRPASSGRWPSRAFERDRETLKYRCPAAGGFDCAGREGLPPQWADAGPEPTGAS